MFSECSPMHAKGQYNRKKYCCTKCRFNCSIEYRIPVSSDPLSVEHDLAHSTQESSVIRPTVQAKTSVYMTHPASSPWYNRSGQITWQCTYRLLVHYCGVRSQYTSLAQQGPIQTTYTVHKVSGSAHNLTSIRPSWFLGCCVHQAARRGRARLFALSEPAGT